MNNLRPSKKPTGTRHRIYHRQILAGGDVQALADPWERAAGKLPLTPLQRNYLLLVLLILVLSGALIIGNLVLLATVPLFLLAMLLILGRFVF